MSFQLLTIPSRAMTLAQSDAVIALCSGVFQIDYGLLMSLCPDRVHVLGYVGGQLVAHALWLDRPLRVGSGPWLNAAYVEGVATHAEQRQRGYGAALMRHLQTEIIGYDLGALSPAVPEWYARLGWERWQGPLWIDHDGDLLATPADEIVLIYRTPRTPTLDLDTPLTAPWRPFELW
jgi:aminoglycoside 2'-N-acetyltransferase I